MLVPRPEVELSTRELVDVLGGTHALTILETVDEPMTVKEISHVADIPLSSTYRRVNALAEANLLTERIAIDPEEGKHVSQYERAFESIDLVVTDEGIAVQVID